MKYTRAKALYFVVGAYFIDRNGRFFEPILDFLRNGTLILPPQMSLESVLVEANFYGIDVMEGLGNIQEGRKNFRSDIPD